MPSTAPLTEPEPWVIDPRVVEGAAQTEHGFRHVDWAPVARWIEARVDPLDAPRAWGEAAIHWLMLLRDDLGGGYSLLTSPDATVLCDQSLEAARWIQEYCRDAAASIREVLGEAANRDWRGGVIVVVFSDLDDYYPYVSHYCPEGEQAASGGMFIGSGFPHIAFPWTSAGQAAQTITHELAHQGVAHLSLPTWLNEGVAMLLERRLSPPDGGVFGMGAPLLDGESALRHAEFWDRDRIQEFWAGTSFGIPGDSNELSYSLAEVLVSLLLQQCPAGAFPFFLRAATPEDSEQAASLDVLGRDLGDVAGTFLALGSGGPSARRSRRAGLRSIRHSARSLGHSPLRPWRPWRETTFPHAEGARGRKGWGGSRAGPAWRPPLEGGFNLARIPFSFRIGMDKPAAP